LLKVDKDPAPLTEPESQLQSCQECVHYFISWDANFPYGCKAMNFKSKRMPQLEVLESSGQPCVSFELKPGGRNSR
jgi:hypothetical protein